ncbi:MAG: SLBB domain-containing protein [Armatimonadota bacterium]|nr:SLBB domain-containing protein [Armatimonadota bacterium]
MIPTVLLAASIFSYGGGDTRPPYTGTYPESAYVRVMPTNAGYELPEVAKLGTVTVTGKVVRPGTYYLYPGMTLSDLIGEAGSFVHEADYDDIRLVRQTRDGELTYSLSWLRQWQRLALLKPGDVVTVTDRGFSAL